MSCPAAATPTIEDLLAASPADRPAVMRAFTAPIFAAADAEDARRLAAGICAVRECSEKVKGGDAGPFDADHCAECARRIELEMLIEDQEDDVDG